MTRRPLIALLAVVAAAALAAASITVVPADGAAWCRGRYLGPGVQLKLPLTRVSRYPAAEQTVTVEATVADRHGSRSPVTLELVYRWDLQRLPRDPVDPQSLRALVEAALAALDGKASADTLESTAANQVRSTLAPFPITVLDLRVTVSGGLIQALRERARPTGQRVVLLGLDGFDWGLLDRLIGEGRCPTFAAMKRSGAWGNIQSRQPLLSPLIWTTMATGRLPEEHGVVDFVVKDAVTGADMPITNQARQVHAFWNILTSSGLSVNVVNWWATYPAEPINGVMVSERVFYQLFGIRPALDDPGNISPPEVVDEVLPLLVEADDIGFDEVREYARIDRAEYDRALAAAATADNPFDERINHLRKILAVTRGVFNVGHWLIENRPADLTALYVEGTDTIGHRFAHFLPPKLPWVSQQEFDRYSGTMARYYELVDRELARLMEHAPPDTLWLVVPDHGLYTGKARPSVAPDDFTTGAPQWHRLTGAFLASGPGVRPGPIEPLHIDDLCRTLLWLLGAPISEELRGRQLEELLGAEWAARHPAVTVDTYDQLPRTWMREGIAPAALDAARLAELQALGYVAGDSSTPPSGQPTPIPEATGAKATEPYNLGKLALGRGDLETAERRLLEALEMRPDFMAAMITLAGVYRERGDHASSLRWILRALETAKPELPPVLLVDFVREAEAAGRLDRALPALEMMRPRWQSEAGFFTARGLALRLLGRNQEAAAEYLAALALDPADTTATEQLLELATAGLDVDTDVVLRRHLAAVRSDLKRLNSFAVLCLRQGRPAIAAEALTLVFDSDPANPGIASNLAVALQMQGKGEQAAAILARAVAARPDGADLRFNHGAVLASLGRYDEALAELEAADSLGNSQPELVAARAKVLFRLGREDEARQVLETGARKHPDNAEIKELLQLLR